MYSVKALHTVELAAKKVPAESREAVDYSYRDEPTYAEAKAKLDELVAANIKAKSKA